MSRILDRLLSPNFWVTIALVLGCTGIVCMIAGAVTENSLLTEIGMWLQTPLIICGFTLVRVVIPLLIIKNRRN
jgi:hypothetical protein